MISGPSRKQISSTTNLLKRRMPHIDYASLMAAIKKNLSRSPIWSSAVGENGMCWYKSPAKNESFEIKITLTKKGALRFYKSAVSGRARSYSIIDFNPQGFLSWSAMNSDKMLQNGIIRSSSGAVIKLEDVTVDDAGELILKLNKDILKDKDFAEKSLLSIFIHISIKVCNVKVCNVNLAGSGQFVNGSYKKRQEPFAILKKLKALASGSKKLTDF